MFNTAANIRRPPALLHRWEREKGVTLGQAGSGAVAAEEGEGGFDSLAGDSLLTCVSRTCPDFCRLNIGMLLSRKRGLR